MWILLAALLGLMVAQGVHASFFTGARAGVHPTTIERSTETGGDMGQ